jgi:hypothetical protein
MPLDTTTIALDAAADDLAAQYDDLVDEAAQHPSDSDEAAIYAERAEEMQTYRAGVAWAREEFGDEAEVTVGALDTGDMGRVTDRTHAAKQSKVGQGEDPPVVGAFRVFYVAAGVVDGPFIDDDPGFEATVRAVRGLDPKFTQFLRSKIDDLSEPEADLGNSFAVDVAQRRAELEASENDSE